MPELRAESHAREHAAKPELDSGEHPVSLGAYPLDVHPAIEKAAARWPLRWVSRKTEDVHEYIRLRGLPAVYQAHLVCYECGQSVACLSPDVERGGYSITDETIRAGIVRHLRQCHEAQVMLSMPSGL